MSSNSHQTHLRSYARPGTWVWMFVHPVIPYFHLPSNVFSFALWTRLGLPHPLAFSLTHCIYDQPLNPMGIHLLRCTHGGERTTSHDVVQDVFMSIVKDMAFHVFVGTNSHFFATFSSIFLSTCWYFFVNWWHWHISQCCNYRPHSSRHGIISSSSHGVVATLAARVNERLYYNHYPTNVFFLLAIEVFGCFQQ